MSKIEEIDVNFKVNEANENGVVYYNCMDKPFSLHGFYSPVETGKFMRLPESFSTDERVNGGVRSLMFHTAGGRVRFVTDSKIVSIRVNLATPVCFMPHMAESGIHGFDMYVASLDKKTKPLYKKTFIPSGVTRDAGNYCGSYEFKDSTLREIIINFPLYNGVENLYIGLCDGCTLKKASPYSIELPMVFYGSSVTQGGCASRPGTNYTHHLSRWLDADFINLGFSGSDLGEEALAEYIATIPMSVFIHAYGYNAPSKVHYENTYYPFYKTVRDEKPNLPIVMMSSPVCLDLKTESIAKQMTDYRQIVINAYEKAIASGDNNVYLIDGFTLLGDSEGTETTVDGTHPTDWGFYNMAKTLYPLLEKILFG
ncbi:MAG: hypothetical protein IJC78_08220 [Clostridia bacterium]|nr:hypothetical protein [Clostridia bacterium]